MATVWQACTASPCAVMPADAGVSQYESHSDLLQQLLGAGILVKLYDGSEVAVASWLADVTSAVVTRDAAPGLAEAAVSMTLTYTCNLLSMAGRLYLTQPWAALGLLDKHETLLAALVTWAQQASAANAVVCAMPTAVCHGYDVLKQRLVVDDMTELLRCSVSMASTLPDGACLLAQVHIFYDTAALFCANVQHLSRGVCDTMCKHDMAQHSLVGACEATCDCRCS
jgi:hypothetical protein